MQQLLFIIIVVLAARMGIRLVRRSKEPSWNKRYVVLSAVCFVLAMVDGTYCGGEHANITGPLFVGLFILSVVFASYAAIRWQRNNRLIEDIK